MTDAEIIRIIAEQVMGWTYWDGDRDYDGPEYATYFTDYMAGPDDSLDVYENGSDSVTRFFNPLESWADAGMVVERMRELGWYLHAAHDIKRTYIAEFMNQEIPDTLRVVGDRAGTLPRAITLAALKAVQW